LPDGDYRLKIKVDPQDRLLEIDKTDNESCVLVRLGGGTGARTVSVLNPNTCGEIAPDSDPPTVPTDWSPPA
jgi:hypothetical protein